MKKRDPVKQAKLQKATTKRALYEKARKQKIKAAKAKQSSPEPQISPSLQASARR